MVEVKSILCLHNIEGDRGERRTMVTVLLRSTCVSITRTFPSISSTLAHHRVHEISRVFETV